MFIFSDAKSCKYIHAPLLGMVTGPFKNPAHLNCEISVSKKHPGHYVLDRHDILFLSLGCPSFMFVEVEF